MRKLFLSALLIALVACSGNTESPGTPVRPTIDRTGQVQQVVVYVHPSYEDVNRALDKYAGKDMPEVYGWSTWCKDAACRCEIHVIKPLHLHTRPVETWGHELMHCVYGSFHPE